DAESNAGGNGDASSEHAGGAVDAPEPWRGTGVDCTDQTHADWEPEPHQEACWRQDKNAEGSASEKARCLEVDEKRGQPERQCKQVGRARRAPGHKLSGSGETHALRCHAAEARPKDEAEQNDTECVGGVAEKDTHALQQSDLDHHESDTDQA